MERVKEEGAYYLGDGMAILNFAGAQQTQYILGPLRDSMLHPEVMSQFLNSQLYGAQVSVTCKYHGKSQASAQVFRRTAVASALDSRPLREPKTSLSQASGR